MDPQRRGLAVLAVIAFLVVAVGLGKAVSRPDMALLYGGLDSAEAGRVLAALDQRGVRYDVRGGSIFVERANRDPLRMSLASDGLPAASGSGYELLDSLSGFGTTSQMFDAAYWRAKEGELARTIVSSPMIRDARVHIATPGASPFRRDTPATASVAITGNGPIAHDTAQSLQYLVASAVANLAPENVSVIDSQTGRVLAPTDGIEGAGHAEDREQELQRRVLRLLEARVGPGNARVEVSIERELSSQTLTERQIDPESRVVISQDTEEISSQAQNGGGGAVTVASNLPTGDSAGDGNSSQEQRAETRERSNFDVSETRRETIVAPGAVKRLSVAVLVNNLNGDAGTGDPVSRSTDELEDLRLLVAAAVGLDEGRGDVLTLRALDFTASAELGTGPAGSSWALSAPDPWKMIQLGVLAIVTVILGIFVVRPLLMAQARPGGAGENSAGALTVLDEPALGDFDTGLTLEAPPADDTGLPALDGGLPTLSVVSDFGEDDDSFDSGSPVDRLKDMIETRQPDTLEILRSWMDPASDETEEA